MDLVFPGEDEIVEGAFIEMQELGHDGPRDEGVDHHAHEGDHQLAGIGGAVASGCHALAELVENGGECAATGAHRHDGHALRIAVEFMDHESRQIGMQEQGADIGVDEAADFLIERSVGRGHHLEDGGEMGAEGVFEDSLEELVLGSEIIMQKGLVDAGGIGDVLRSGAIEAGPMEDFAGGGEDAVAGCGIVLTAWFNHVVNVASAIFARKCPQHPLHNYQISIAR